MLKFCTLNIFKMNKYQILLIGLLFCSVTGLAQYQNVTEDQKKEIVGKIALALSNMNTMQCDFTQVKELTFIGDKATSEGKMFYKKTNKLRWEYTKPVQYAFSTDGKNLWTSAGGKTTAVPAGQRKLLDGMNKVMISGVTGTGLVSSPDFDTDLFMGTDDYKIVLIPKKKEVKDLYSSIQLYVNKQNNRTRSVELIEKKGDKTTIELKNIQVNKTINDAIFSQ